MVGTTTITRKGSSEVVPKSTDEKARDSICLTGKADGTKLKPFVVFKGAKREVAKLNEEFRGRRVVASSEKGWMNTPPTLQWIQQILGSFSFN